MFKTLGLCAIALASIAACSTTARPATRTAAAAACPQNSSASRIAQPGQCSSTPGRTYSQEDIERTGQTDVGNALQQLDPSISVHH